MEQLQRDFKGVWIEKDIWLNKELTWMEKLMYAEISSLDNSIGCIASNAYLGNFFNLSQSRVSEIISSLVEKKYLYILQEKELTANGWKTNRVIKASENRRLPSEYRRDPSENRKTPSEKAQYINTIINTFNNTQHDSKKVGNEKESITDITEFIKEQNLKHMNSPINLTKHHYIQLNRLVKTYSKDIVLAKLKTYYSVSFAVWFTKQGKTLGSFLKNFDEIPVTGAHAMTDDELIHNHPDKITGWSMKDEDLLCRTPKEREQYRRGLLIEMRR